MHINTFFVESTDLHVIYYWRQDLSLASAYPQALLLSKHVPLRPSQASRSPTHAGASTSTTLPAGYSQHALPPGARKDLWNLSSTSTGATKRWESANKRGRGAGTEIPLPSSRLWGYSTVPI
ncbi:hypothetical protein BT69DRAFT_1131817 [Atractiella rhizophila]|nr:hypothetical protein BT69DRAFT_1131817 [Atractiella rhizophila]